MKKSILCLLSLALLTACQTGSEVIYPFGEKTDLSKSYHLYRSEAKEGESYEDYLPTLGLGEAKELLERGESLSILFEKKGCSACERFFPVYQRLQKDLGVETYTMDLKNAQQLYQDMGYTQDTRFGHYTPTWYILSKEKLDLILYPNTKDTDALYRSVKTAMKAYQSPYNAYRIDSLTEWEGLSKEGVLLYYLDSMDKDSLSFYQEHFLPYLEKSTQKSLVLDARNLSSEEKTSAEALFTEDGALKPIQKGKEKKALAEGAAFLESLLSD